MGGVGEILVLVPGDFGTVVFLERQIPACGHELGHAVVRRLTLGQRPPPNPGRVQDARCAFTFFRAEVRVEEGTELPIDRFVS